MDCRGFVDGGAGYGPRAGPPNDIRILDVEEEKTEGFLAVDGIGRCDRGCPSGGGIIEKRRSAMSMDALGDRR